MSTPVIPSHKIKGKHKVNQFIRDTYAGYQRKTPIPLKMTTEELHRRSSVNVTVKKYMGKHDGYYRYYYYKTFTQKKPERVMAMSLPVFMQRKHKQEK